MCRLDAVVADARVVDKITGRHGRYGRGQVARDLTEIGVGRQLSAAAMMTDRRRRHRRRRIA